MSNEPDSQATPKDVGVEPHVVGDAVVVGDWGALAWKHLDRLLTIVISSTTMWLLLACVFGSSFVVAVIQAAK